jgi:hypothetical protein
MQIAIDVDARRAVAKMACNLFALRDRSAFMGAGFDGVRKFVLDGGGIADAFVICNTKPIDIAVRRKAIGPLDHLLLVKGNAAGRVEALVVLFGHIQFCVALGNGPSGSPFVTTYRVDQLGGVDRLDDRRDSGLAVRHFAKVAASSHVARLHEMGAGTRRIFGFILRRQDDGFREDMIQRSIEEAFGPPDGKPISQAQVENFSTILATRMVRYLEHTGQLRHAISNLEATGLI